MENLLEKIKSGYAKLKNKSGRKIIRPSHDWKIMLIATFVILLFGAISAFYFYLQINDGKLFVVMEDTKEKEVKLDNVLLKSTIQDLNLRESLFTKIRQNKSVPREPSL